MSAVWVPPGVQYFRDFTGKSLSLGTIELYVPGTFTDKLTWADEAQTQANTNPVDLDAAGSAPIWGTGLYRMIAKDQFGVQVFDLITGFVASGGGGGGDVFGPGSSTPGNFAVWASGDGTQIADGGIVGTLAHLSSINNANWAGTPLSVGNGGTGATTQSGAQTNLGLGVLATQNTITASQISDYTAALYTALTTMLVQSGTVTITPNAGAHTFTFTSAGGGGGGVVGPVSSVNGELVAFNGTTGGIITNTACVPSANGFSLISAANYAAMRTALSLTTAATTALGTSGATIPLLSTANTWTLGQTFSAVATFTLAPVFTDAPGTRTALGLGTASTFASTAFEPAGAYSGYNAQTASYTLVLADQGKLVTVNNASANNLTVPPHSSVALPVLARIDIGALGAGQTTVVQGAGVTVLSSNGLKLRAQNSGATLVQLTTDVWWLNGDTTP